MTLRSLLVPVSGHPADGMSLDAALGLARAFEAHIAAVCIRPDPADVIRHVAEWSYPILIENAVATAERYATELASKAGTMFEAWRQRHRLALATSASKADGVSVSWRERIGEPGAILRDASRFTDLVIMRGLGETGPIEGDAMLEAVLFDAGRPALLVPPKAPANPFGAALVAWDGGREELHALTAALPILAKMKRVEICTVGDHADAKPDELVIYLGRHGIAAQLVELKPVSGGAGETLLQETRRIEAGLLVMGGYHHSRAREVVFGGTTRHIVTNVEIPVLLAH